MHNQAFPADPSRCTYTDTKVKSVPLYPVPCLGENLLGNKYVCFVKGKDTKNVRINIPRRLPSGKGKAAQSGFASCGS